ncbi:hypothetical protein MCOR25_010435 [Pyricularia grisea]|nr:hypothetical protein MCOR25_010435 [Pyricularia grisea]
MAAEKIIPLHEYDSMPFLTGLVLTLLLKYDRVLDPDVLRDAMIKLIDREGWRKLGSRLKRDAKGNLVYHVPAKFDESNPAIAFSHVHYDTTMADHPLARQFPSPKSSHLKGLPSVVLAPAPIIPLARRADAPRTMAELIARGLPQLQLHVVTFRDGTTVGISFLHSLLDGMGLGASGLLGAWSLVLHGKEDEVPPVCGDDQDVLAGLRKLHRPTPTGEGKPAAAPVEWKHARYLMGSLDVLKFILRRTWDILRYREEEMRVVRVPGAFVTRLREAVLERLATTAMAGDSHDGAGDRSSLEGEATVAAEKKPWVSEGDVLVAWWSRYATLHLANKPDKPVIVTNAYNMRKMLAGTLLPAPPRDGERAPVYLANCATGLNVFTTVGGIAETAATAAEVRRTLVELGTLDQLAVMQATVLPDPRKLWKMRMAGLPDAHMCIFTNWSQASFYQIDLSPAVVARGEQQAGDGEGQGQGQALPSFVACKMDSKVWPQRDQFVIIGKDGQGDYWISGTLRKGLWAKIEEELGQEKV